MKALGLKLSYKFIGYSRLVSKINTEDLNKINIEEIEISFVDKVKSLGITIDLHAATHTHTHTHGNIKWKTCRQVFGALHKIRLCGHFMSKNLKYRLVQSLVMPYFRYCDLW